jgi:hypothetical protein
MALATVFGWSWPARHSFQKNVALAQNDDEDSFNHIILANDHPLDFSAKRFDKRAFDFHFLMYQLDVNIDRHHVPPHAVRLLETKRKYYTKLLQVTTPCMNQGATNV